MTLDQALAQALAPARPFVTVLTVDYPNGHQCWLHEVDGRLFAATRPEPDQIRKTPEQIARLLKLHPEGVDPWWGCFIERESIRRIEVRGPDGWSLAYNADGWRRGHHTRLDGDTHSVHG